MRRLHDVPRNDDGAVAILYSIVLVLVILPLLAIGTTTMVRSATQAELQRAADSGALAGAAAIPFGDVNFARNFIDVTSNGATDATLQQLGLSYNYPDPKSVACDGVAIPDATNSSDVGSTYAVPGTLTCKPTYLSDLDTLSAVRQCAEGLAAQAPAVGGVTSGVGGLLPGGTTSVPDLSPLLPVLLRPGVQVKMSWQVKSPTGSLLGGHDSTESVTSVAHRRFKDMVVVPTVTLPVDTSGTGIPNPIDLNPYVGDLRSFLLSAIDGTEKLLADNPATAECATVFDAMHDDIVDAISPPSNPPSFNAILDDALATHSPVIVANVVTGLAVPFLDFFPVCVDYANGHYIGHATDFGSCSVTAPGAFRASLRNS